MERLPVALGGFMGTGKSTIGPRVARHLGLDFVDLDRVVEAEAGCSVAALFEAEGEAGFRARERLALERIVAGPPVVLSLGGGTLHQAGNRALLEGRYRVIILDLSWPMVRRRLGGRSKRPLAGDSERLYLERRPGYLQAGTVVSVERKTLGQAARAVLQALGEVA